MEFSHTSIENLEFQDAIVMLDIISLKNNFINYPLYEALLPALLLTNMQCNAQPDSSIDTIWLTSNAETALSVKSKRVENEFIIYANILEFRTKWTL